MTALIDQFSGRKKFLNYIFNNNYIDRKIIKCPKGALLKFTFANIWGLYRLFRLF